MVSLVFLMKRIVHPSQKRLNPPKLNQIPIAHVSIPLEQGTLYVKYAARASEDLHIPLQEGQVKLLFDHLSTEKPSEDAQPRAYNKSGKFEGVHGKYLCKQEVAFMV